MPITLVTGLPGHGKTLYTLARWKDEAEKEKRQVFYSNIRDLNIPGWKECDPEKWEELPPGSLVIIDECQFKFPTRGRGSPPPWIEKLATHRHLGLDFILITQNPMLIDSFVRRLVDRHFHVVRKFGTKFATIHEFVNGAKDAVEKSREGSIRHEWRYPTKVFDWYKSAEVHTVKRRIPAKVFVLAAIPVIFCVLAWMAYQRLNAEAVSERTTGELAKAVEETSGPGIQVPGEVQPGATLTAADWMMRQTPRVPGFAHTAAAYDEVTKPVIAPYPAACVVMKGECRCYTQQATRLSMPEDTCRQIVERGFFVDWRQDRGDEPARLAKVDPEPASVRAPEPAVPRF